MRRSRSPFPVLAVASLAAALAATPATAQDPAAISVFGFGYETGDQIAQVRIDRFRSLHPDIEVTFSESGWDEQQFIASLSGSSVPDVVNIPRNVIGSYASRGVLTPLDECLAAESVDPAVYRESAVSQVTFGGQLYGLPQFFNTRLWFMNRAAFEEAGLDPETIDLSDWDAIAEANTALTRSDGQLTRIGIDPKLPEFLPLWAAANGARLLSDDGLTSQLEDPAIAEALTFTRGLLDAAGGPAPFLDFRSTWDFFGAQNQVATDQIAAWPMEQWYLNVLADVSPDAPILVRPFLDRSGEPISWSDGDAFAIVAGSPNAAAACTFIATMTHADTWIEAARARAETRAAEGKPNTGVYTANRDADAVIFGEIVDLSDMPAFQQAVEAILEVQDRSFALPPAPAGAEVEQAWRAAVERALAGGDPAAELAIADAEAQAALDSAGR